jgi:hypothetical protein
MELLVILKCMSFLYKLSKFSISNCQNFPFQTVKISLYKLSKFPFTNCQNFPFQTVKIFLVNVKFQNHPEQSRSNDEA